MAPFLLQIALEHLLVPSTVLGVGEITTFSAAASPAALSQMQHSWLGVLLCGKACA
jgi:hypothetical protein